MKSIDQYILSHPKWQNELNLLRELLNEHGLSEGIKWGVPVYMVDGKNIIGLAAFKSYFGLWFYQGALLNDRYKVLYNAQEGKTQAMRQWRFEKLSDIDLKKVSEYIQEAVNNQKSGKTVKFAKKELVIPTLLKSALDADKNLASSFTAFTKSKQREFADFIIAAKRAETKQKRLDKIIPMILEGIGLNDSYR